MSRNGPLALAFHALFVTFILAPIVIVCAVASLLIWRPTSSSSPGSRTVTGVFPRAARSARSATASAASSAT